MFQSQEFDKIGTGGCQLGVGRGGLSCKGRMHRLRGDLLEGCEIMNYFCTVSIASISFLKYGNQN